MHHFGGFAVQTAGTQLSRANFLAHLCQKMLLLHPLILSLFPSFNMNQLGGLKWHKTPFLLLFWQRGFSAGLGLSTGSRKGQEVNTENKAQARKRGRNRLLHHQPHHQSTWQRLHTCSSHGEKKKKESNSSEIGRILFLLLKPATSQVTTF